MDDHSAQPTLATRARFQPYGRRLGAADLCVEQPQSRVGPRGQLSVRVVFQGSRQAASHTRDHLLLRAARCRCEAPIGTAVGPCRWPGAADDDPSGIATYSQGVAQFGFQLAWTL